MAQLPEPIKLQSTAPISGGANALAEIRTLQGDNARLAATVNALIAHIEKKEA